MTGHNRRNRRERTSMITANVCGVVVRGSSPQQVVTRLEQLAEEAEDSNKRELFRQHAEHYRKMVN